MKKYTVIIPTTNNVVGINDIVEEDPLVSSVICENNNLEALPISSLYNSFVKSPTGIIEKLIGHPSFRIDITKPIHNGKSWQLAIAIAHIFLKNNILNFSNENQLLTNKTEEIIWASGTINSNLEIKKINYLDKKIYNSSNSWSPYRVFIIGNSQPTNLNKYLEAIEKNLNKKADIILEKMQPGDVEKTFANTEALEEWIQFKPNTSIEEGVKNFIDWYLTYHENDK